MATTLRTWQQFEEAGEGGRGRFLLDAIRAHRSSEAYRTAIDADLYDHQRNRTINEYVQTIFTLSGDPVEDFTASNAKVASNFFNALNTQRRDYSLGNGITFAGRDGDGDSTKELLGPEFDEQLREWAYDALIHGVAFGYWCVDHLHVFRLTEFVPLWDGRTGRLMGGIRFWRLDDDLPMTVTVYTPEGHEEWRTTDGTDSGIERVGGVEKYRQQTISTEAFGTEVVGEDNWGGALPIVPMWGSRLRQSTLVGLRQQIDSYDLINSGFANDLTDCSQIYWLVANAGGMSDADLARFRDRMRLTHVASVDTDQGASATPVTPEVPHEARDAYLDRIERRMYRDFGVLDTASISGGGAKTASEIEAAYHPMDSRAADFEKQVRKAVQALLGLIGVEDTPVFKRMRVSNQLEQVQIVSLESQWLDRETILAKLPNVTPDEAQAILERSDAEDARRFGALLGDSEPVFGHDGDGVE